MGFTAHIRDDNETQSVKEHSDNTAELAESYLKSRGLSSVGYLCGLLHDIGKLQKDFDDYINKRNNLPKGSIDHSYAGAKYLTSLAGDDKKAKAAAIGMAHTIVSHHSIHDWIDDNCKDSFGKRILNDKGYDEILSNVNEIIGDKNINDLFEKAVKEWFEAAIKCKKISKDNTEACFYIGMLERLIQSALIDADRTDTADFMSGVSPAKEIDTAHLWADMDKCMDKKLKSFENNTDAISLQRRSISDRCAAFANHKVDACRLIVSTGGGKTLSSLRFAIKQCKEFGMKKILYIAPFMSILEQNSDVISELAGEENFLEHHSNMISEIDDENELQQYMLYSERWTKPVIATTMVQFLNTLFSAKTSSVRRMHSLCDSVIIIDEVQSIPIKCTHLFSLAVNFLTKICGSTVVLCSATQPTFEKNPTHPLLLDYDKDMTGSYDEDFKVFKRTEIIPALKEYGYENEQAADFCFEKFKENGDLLLIVNTKKQALEMYKRLKVLINDDAYIIHLSTNMCPAHRKKRINTLRRFLKKRVPVICVTTQLIEAGVDISFRCVVRSLAGLDSIAQAAGRCNRSGENKHLCPVYIINFKSENLGCLEQIKTSQDISLNMISHGYDLSEVDTQSRYFDMLFARYENRLSYMVKDGTTDSTIVELLSTNKHRRDICKNTEPVLSQAFKTAGKLFEVIDQNTRNVIVPYNKKAVSIIESLNSDLPPNEVTAMLRKAQKYTVSIYAGTERKLFDAGALYENKAGIVFLNERFYSDDFGVTAEGAQRDVLMY